MKKAILFCTCAVPGWTRESMRTTARAMLDVSGDDKLIPFILHRRSEEPEIKDLPLAPEMIQGKKGLATYRAWAGHSEFFRPFTLPPGTARERLMSLRTAFKATLEDLEFIGDANNYKLTIHYVSGERAETHVRKTLAMSAEAKANLKFLVRKR